MAILFASINPVAQLRGPQRNSAASVGPDPVHATAFIEAAGAGGITASVAEADSAIIARDLYLLKQTVSQYFMVDINASDQEHIKLVIDVLPHFVNLTSVSAGKVQSLAIRGHEKELEQTLMPLRDNNIATSALIAPDTSEVRAAAKLGLAAIEINSTAFAQARAEAQVEEYHRIKDALLAASHCGLKVFIGRELSFLSIRNFKQLQGIFAFTISRALAARALMCGYNQAVKQLLSIIS